MYIGGGEDTLPRKEGGDTGPGGAVAIGRDGGDRVPGGRTSAGGRGAPAVIEQTNAGAPWQMRLSWMIVRQGEEARMGPQDPPHW